MKTISSRGGTVEITMKGVTEVQNKLRELSHLPMEGDRYMIQAGQLVMSELQEDIIGNRTNPRSVRTGTLANSITIFPIINEGKVTYMIIGPKEVGYIDSDLNTVDVIKLLAGMGRSHVISTKERTKSAVEYTLMGSFKNAVDEIMRY